MVIKFQEEAFPILKKYLFYLQTVRQKSVKTVDEYFIDLRTFFRYLKRSRNLVSSDIPFEKIPIDDIEVTLLQSVTLNDAFEYMNYLQRERGNQAAARSRKVSSLRGFFNYISNK